MQNEYGQHSLSPMEGASTIKSGLGHRDAPDHLSLSNLGKELHASHAYFDQDEEDKERSKSNNSRNARSTGVKTANQKSAMITPARHSRNNTTIVVTDSSDKTPISIDLVG